MRAHIKIYPLTDVVELLHKYGMSICNFRKSYNIFVIIDESKFALFMITHSELIIKIEK